MVVSRDNDLCYQQVSSVTDRFDGTSRPQTRVCPFSVDDHSRYHPPLVHVERLNEVSIISHICSSSHLVASLVSISMSL